MGETVLPGNRILSVTEMTVYIRSILENDRLLQRCLGRGEIQISAITRNPDYVL